MHQVNSSVIENDGQLSEQSINEEGIIIGCSWQGLRPTFTRFISAVQLGWSRFVSIRIPRFWDFSVHGLGATTTADSATAEEDPIAQEREDKSCALWSRQQAETDAKTHAGNLATHFRYQLTCLEERIQRLESHQSRTYRLVVSLKRTSQMQEQEIHTLMAKTKVVDAVEQQTMPLL